jgi:7-cyano-7-deazaguanine synthase
LETVRGKRAIALVSGGLDSVVSLAKAHESMDIRLVLFANYGQQALDREREAVIEVANFYGLPLHEVDLTWLGGLGPEGMRRGGETGAALDSLDAVWIPNRNGVFLNVAAAFAESYRCDTVITGFNREEADDFPDNSAEFVEHANHALVFSTRNRVEVVSFTQALDKPEILGLGTRLGAPLSVIWSCYRAGESMCGSCASCARLRAALAAVPEADRPMIVFGDES